MDAWKRRAVGYFALVGLAIVLTAAGYWYGMNTYESGSRYITFLDALQFAVEMFTTTGFGGDSPWNSPQMQAYILVTDLVGMAILVGALPVFIGPLLNNVLETAAPTEIRDADLSDHVVICSDTARADELMTELDASAIPYVIVESDRERADKLYDEGHRVINADPQSETGLRVARLPKARALFADVSDQVDASIVLTAKELAEEVPVVSVVEDPTIRRYHKLAGGDYVLSPRQLLGERLAAKVTMAMRMEIDEVEIGEELRLGEIPIGHGSDLVGTTLATSQIRERTGVNVIGAWVDGEFTPAPSPELELSRGTILLVTGRQQQLTRLVNLAQTESRQFQAGQTVIIGYGNVGQVVSEKLEQAEIPHTVVDEVDRDGVDIVGDATDPDVLTAAGVSEAETIVLALPDDTTTEFATLVVRDLAPEAEILARSERDANVSKTYRAGADYVLSLTTVAGRMSAARIIEDRDFLSIEQQVKTVRTTASTLVGQTIEEADISDQTGCTVVAIERNGGVLTDVGPDTEIKADDELVVVGTDHGIRTFEDTFA